MSGRMTGYVRARVVRPLAVLMTLVLASCRSSFSSVDFWNLSGEPIAVISVRGVQAYGKRRGPQDLRCGNMLPGGLKSSWTSGTVRILHPIRISWIDRVVWHPERFPEDGDHVQTVYPEEIEGLAPGRAKIPRGGTLLFLFVGPEWKAFCLPESRHMREDDVRRLLAGEQDSGSMPKAR